MITLYIKRERVYRGYTQKDVCNTTRIKRSGYSDIENGYTYPNILELCRIARFLGVAVTDLFSYIDEE